jgi:hypothetical protein
MQRVDGQCQKIRTSGLLIRSEALASESHGGAQHYLQKQSYLHVVANLQLSKSSEYYIVNYEAPCIYVPCDSRGRIAFLDQGIEVRRKRDARRFPDDGMNDCWKLVAHHFTTLTFCYYT